MAEPNFNENSGIAGKLSLVIPTYNESRSIGNLCKEIIRILSGNGINFEIIVVDDNSPDGTWKIIQDLTGNEKSIRLVQRFKKRGLAEAVVEGWNNAEGGILGVIDGDLQHPPEIIPLMVKKLLDDQGLDIVVASRNIRGGGVSHWSAWRKFISFLGKFISYIFLHKISTKVKDPLSGYFVFRRKVIQGKPLDPLGYKILLEVLAKGEYKKVCEVPYIFKERPRGGSKVGLRQCFEYLVQIYRLSRDSGNKND